MDKILNSELTDNIVHRISRGAVELNQRKLYKHTGQWLKGQDTKCLWGNFTIYKVATKCVHLQFYQALSR